MSILLRLKTSLYRAHYRFFSQRKYRAASCRNAEFILCPENYVDRRIWVEGIYEPQQIQTMLDYAAQYTPDMFLDIGGNIGLYTNIIGRNTNIPVIHTFECDPRNLAMLRAHIHMNKLAQRTVLHEYAVGEDDGEIDLYMAANSNTGKSSVVAASTKDHQVHKVRLRKIDNVLDAKNQTILIKMDIEGYEKFALRGMQNILVGNKCILQVEILPNSQGEETQALLQKAGFQMIKNIEHDYYFKNF